MADTEAKLAISVEMHESVPDTSADKDSDNYKNFDADAHVRTENDPIEESKTNTSNKKQMDELPPAQYSAGEMLRRKSEAKGQRLKVVVGDLWEDATSPKAGQSNDTLTADVNTKSTSLIHSFTSILIDEVNDDTITSETSIITLPKSPICALLLMESVGIYQSLEKTNQMSIIASIIVTIIAQISAAATLFTKQLYTDVKSDYEASDGFLNLIVVSFVVIYLSQDCAQVYKMVVLLRWMRHADKLKRHSAILIFSYLITNFLLYAFLLYYSVVELLLIDDPGEKLQAAVAVYFILELDDWLYSVTIEPLKILEDDIFNLSIKGKPGSKQKRLKHVTYWFWGVFAAVLCLQLILFIFRVQDNLTIDEDTTPSPTAAASTS
mmetsp:Transcript_22248/g.19575  ORF Transcript_22248/g.19575 Transcript_22248/m.19575 type:complete len:380 (-) Transcript_22248:201-1340(-)